ncbi:uncharacterized protein TNCV_2447651 [Trichonephila clavipes]|uniref:Uncharacterized protein n=1 Tax=Trichonephila clavipes TaxID=2585209 RepID=A0A8X6VH65_TRICX|nr:uncharacterized protein TNCV_2447651 [Trichonephila clavipes]
MTTVDFLHHENPPTLAGVEPAILGADGQRKSNCATQSELAESTGHPRVTMPNEDGIWQLLPKETDGTQHQTYLVSSLQLPVRQLQGRPCTDD